VVEQDRLVTIDQTQAAAAASRACAALASPSR
jgi:hypothetical protein